MKPLVLTFVLSCGADAATTHYSLTHGGTEVVLPTQNPYVVDAIVGVQAVLGTWAFRTLDKRGHHKAARIVGWTLTSFRLASVGWNLTQLP